MAKTRQAKSPHGVTQEHATATSPIRNRRAPTGGSPFSDGNRNANEDDHTQALLPQEVLQGGDPDTPSNEAKRTRIQLQELSIKYPDYMGQSMVSFLVFLMAATMRADWILFMTCFWKSLDVADLDGVSNPSSPSSSILNTSTNSASQHQRMDLVSSSESGNSTWNAEIKEMLSMRLVNLEYFMIPSFLVSYLFFFGIGGFLHFWYYVKQRENAKEWKCQPNHWLSPKLELHEITVGFFSLNIGAFISACLACWVMNDGYSTLYFNISDYGYLWFLLQWPAIFIMQDYLTYWIHRIYHMPFLYKHFHKLHHTYKHPTAFSVTAIHPFEFVSIQCIYISPIFTFPVHWVPYTFILLYTYYHGIIDHSGINFKRHWWQPWQPDCIFHDNHHQYFHVNFGFNIRFWDKFHGTHRRKDRVYTEDIFWGTGKEMDKLSPQEIQADLAERNAENPLAYHDNKMAFRLSQSELQNFVMSSNDKK
ncbi:hypothetical protein TCAL_14769 [Tigriopus californicus]|uniref:Fatty acid hydroxylase domain-containing protein n=1 Tax=Tigriopus californicus TaxID=6832 RepID=A0A553PGI1_TIGCA|nr:uncharacterized protein LOC131880675 [Tigriopus californicus]TRY76780.1 hypothetical protein TCAL_14769 [Tigriopus californicus]